MLNISVSKGLTEFKPIFVENIVELSEIIKHFNWSQSVFNDGYRDKQHFQSASCIALDVDEGCTLVEAVEIFKDFKHIITTTKSHQKEKNGLVCDRFRVILFTETEMTNQYVFENTWFSLLNQFPFIDEACKDCSRFYYPSIETISVNEEGQLIPLVHVETKVDMPLKRTEIALDLTNVKLSRQTLDFLVNGAPEGKWHLSLFKAAVDWKEQGLDEVSFMDKAERITGHLDDHDHHVIRDVFENRESKYLPRNYMESLEIQAQGESLIYQPKDFLDKSLNFLKDKDKVYGQTTGLEGLDKLLGGGKRLGEITALTATAKAGKSALTHFLIFKWLKLGLPVGFASREMSPETEVTPNLLSLAFQENAWKQDLSEEIIKKYTNEILTWPIYYARGYGYLSIDEFKAWAKQLKSKGVNYFVLDHLLYSMANPEDFKEVSLFMRELKKFVNEEQIHVDLIIQPRNLQLGEKIGAHSLRGGANIAQAISTLLTLERVPESRNITKLSLEIGRSRLSKQGSIYLQYNSETTEFTEVEPDFSENKEIEDRDIPHKGISNKLSNVIKI